MKKVLIKFEEVPYGGLISYPPTEEMDKHFPDVPEKLYHKIRAWKNNEHEAMSGTIAEHIPYDHVVSGKYNRLIHQSLCSHIGGGEEPCPVFVFYHKTCECCKGR